jgi:two-component system invasion response regulator UvrY
MWRILIADDHAVVRHGYKQFLAGEPGVAQVAEASSTTDTLEKLRVQPWDLLLLDIHMPGRSGLEVLPEIVSQYPKLRILVISGLPETLYARDVLRAGAHGYLSKGGPAEELMMAVRAILLGRHYVSQRLAQLMVDDLAQDASKPLHARLSARELQIFCRLAGGSSVSNIARELGLSVKTVSTYRTRILQKMTFSSNAEITAYALRNNLTQQTEPMGRTVST